MTAERRRQTPAAGVERGARPRRGGQSAAALRGVRDGGGARGASGRCSCPATARRWTRREVDELLASAAPGVVIVPDRHGTGTNALLLDAADGARAGLRPRLVRAPRRARPRGGRDRPGRRLPSLELDVDTPGDLAALRAALAAGHGGRAADAARCSSGCVHAAPVSARRAPGHAGGAAGRRPRRAARATRGSELGPERRPRRSRTRSSPRPRAACAALADVEPAGRARELAAEHGKDPRHVQVILDETAELAARRPRPPDLPHPPRLRVRQRGRRRVQHRRARHRRPAAGGPRRLGPRAARAALRLARS